MRCATSELDPLQEFYRNQENPIKLCFNASHCISQSQHCGALARQLDAFSLGFQVGVLARGGDTTLGICCDCRCVGVRDSPHRKEGATAGHAGCDTIAGATNTASGNSAVSPIAISATANRLRDAEGTDLIFLCGWHTSRKNNTRISSVQASQFSSIDSLSSQGSASCDRFKEKESHSSDKLNSYTDHDLWTCSEEASMTLNFPAIPLNRQLSIRELENRNSRNFNACTETSKSIKSHKVESTESNTALELSSSSTSLNSHFTEISTFPFSSNDFTGDCILSSIGDSSLTGISDKVPDDDTFQPGPQHREMEAGVKNRHSFDHPNTANQNLAACGTLHDVSSFPSEPLSSFPSHCCSYMSPFGSSFVTSNIWPDYMAGSWSSPFESLTSLHSTPPCLHPCLQYHYQCSHGNTIPALSGRQCFTLTTSQMDPTLVDLYVTSSTSSLSSFPSSILELDEEEVCRVTHCVVGVGSDNNPFKN